MSFRRGVLELVLVIESTTPFCSARALPFMPLPIRVEERETFRSHAESCWESCYMQCFWVQCGTFFHSLGCCACKSSSGHAAPGGCKAMQPKASLKVARAKRCLSCMQFWKACMRLRDNASAQVFFSPAM